MAQILFADQVFCTADEVQRYFTSISLLFHSEINGSEIQSCIDDAKEIWIRQPLIAECQQRFPETIESWRAYKRAKLDERNAAQGRSIELSTKSGSYPLLGFVDYNDGFFDIGDISNGKRPVTFYLGDVPTNGANGSYVGTAESGDMLFDTSTDLGYINRGSLSSPLWQRFIADDGIDYILNPEELKWVNIFACGKIMAEKGSMADKPNFQNAAIIDFYQQIADAQFKNYTQTLKNALPRIKFNISGTGTATAYEISALSGEIVLF